MKEIAPSNELRKWFGHQEGRWQEFKKKYNHELKEHADLIKELAKLAKKKTVTLVYAARDELEKTMLSL